MAPPTDDLNSLRRTAISSTLRRTTLFADLPVPHLSSVTEACSLRSLAKGEILFREGERSDGFFVVRTGTVSVSKITPDGREQVICVFREPESFAEVTLATIETYPANATALEPSQVIVVHKGPFLDLIRRQPELALRMLASMSVHLKHLVQSLQDLKGTQIEYRLADWLLRHSPAAAAGCPTRFELPISKRNLASQLGVTSETLSRTFARFRSEGIIVVDGAVITILDGPGLRAYTHP
ncbi:Crp/Fnr family transcriptional regulator [Nibricoccus sp. IMCC34717]|uniref:Crp/Fnr family transcriptional regulator n=1 Tax=Nibricoccus sp. IMCC34717 TaxID=3034021 RepID=UPI00384C1696